MAMVVLDIEAHKRNHTVVAVDENGRKLGGCTTGTTNCAASPSRPCA